MSYLVTTALWDVNKDLSLGDVGYFDKKKGHFVKVHSCLVSSMGILQHNCEKKKEAVKIADKDRNTSSRSLSLTSRRNRSIKVNTTKRGET